MQKIEKMIKNCGLFFVDFSLILYPKLKTTVVYPKCIHYQLQMPWEQMFLPLKGSLKIFFGHYSTIQITAQWCVLTNSSPLGVGQAPVENSWGTYKTKNVAQKKLALKGTFRLIPYLHKKWSLSTMNLPVQDLNSKSGCFDKCKNWGF